MMSTPSEVTPPQDPLAPVLGRVASGVFILTVGDGQGNETGMLASWVQQAGFDPPAVTVAVNRDRWWRPWLDAHPRMALSIIASTQKEMLRHFGKGFAKNEAAFTNLEITRGSTGLPLLARSIGTLEGKIVSRMASGDHEICLVQIESATTGSLLEGDTPMVHIRKSGLRY